MTDFSDNPCDSLLLQAGIRPSPARILVARELMAAGGVMSAQQLEERLLTVDRSSITRTLTLFSARGLVHVVDDGSGSVKYELCAHPGGSGRHSDLHPHFHCLQCGDTVCLDTVAVPTVPLPTGFRATAVNYVIKGICPRCRSNAPQDS